MIQRGLAPKDWKPLVGVGPGVREIRIRTTLQHRVIYVAKFAEAVYVVHAFEKKTRKTPLRDLEIARRRLGEMSRRRRHEGR